MWQRILKEGTCYIDMSEISEGRARATGLAQPQGLIEKSAKRTKAN
jgi:hypothetical protein